MPFSINLLHTLKYLQLITLTTLVSCNNIGRISKVNSQTSESSSIHNDDLTNIAKYDDAGNVVELEGFKKSEKLDDDSNLGDIEGFAEIYENEENVFDFSSPEGFEAEFSKPVIVTGSSLLLSNQETQFCSNLSFQSQEPTVKELIDHANRWNMCGKLEINYCIRLSKTSPGNSAKYTYIQIPPIHLNLPCADETFSSIEISNEQKSNSEGEKSELLIINAPNFISEVSLSNSASCPEEGSWLELNDKPINFPSLSENKSGVIYAKFRDIFGNESKCLAFNLESEKLSEPVEDSKMQDTSPPSSITVKIGEGKYTANAVNTIYLSAEGAKEMYISTTPNCSSGGIWESYKSTKIWTLEQLNTVATVYAKFRDEAGNESSCINDIITHDDIAPSSPILDIGTGNYTLSSANTLFLSATDAAEMYITNIPGCDSGGSWEGYATTKSNWVLAQSNGNATVYAKFRDLAGNQTLCISDAIVHDNIAPSAPNNFQDGNTTHSLNKSPTISWNGSTDEFSGVSNYEISIGTTLGETNIKNWTDVGNVTNTNFNDLNLTLGSTYYTNIRAVDNAGNTSTVISSDSFIFGYLQESYIKASNNDSLDKFGKSVAIDGDTIVISAENEDSNQNIITNGIGASSNNSNTDSGAVYVYRKTGSNWNQEAYIKASNNDAGDKFGHSVAISGDTIVISSEREDSNQTTITNGSGASSNNSSMDSGAIYVYRRSGNSWAQEAYIKAPNNDTDDKFGKVVAISGDTIVVGAENEDSNQKSITNSSSASYDNSNMDSGAVYVFKRSGTTWIQEAYIKPSNSEAGDKFGHSVAIDGDTIVASTEKEDSNQTSITNGSSASNDNNNMDSGAAYVFTRSGSTWTQSAYIKAANNDPNDKFGKTVAISNNTIVVTSEAEDSNQATISNGQIASSNNSNTDSGALYVYKKNAGNWAQEAYIKPSNSDTGDKFGHAVAIAGNFIVASAEREDSNQSVISNGSGASNNNSHVDSGGVYVFERTGSTWAQIAYIKAANADAGDKFGKDVSISGSTIVVSSEFEDSIQSSITNGSSASTDNSSADSGSAYVYE